jgi:RND family efflux transporter MFP subunit
MRKRSVAVAVVALAAIAACSRDQPYEKPLTPVVVRAVESYVEAGGFRYSATVEPNVRVDLAFKRGGYVESLLQVRGADGIARSVQEGDLVASGAVLATLRQSDYVDKRTQAEAQLREAEASLSHATSESERAGRLFATGSLTKRDYDAAQTQVDVIRAKRDGARALVQEAQNAVADTNLASPIDGVVLKRLVEVGSLAGPGTPGFVIADSRRVKVVFGAPDRIVSRVKVGRPLTVTVAAIPGERFRGSITRIAPAADPRSRVFDVEITIANPDRRLKVGMIAALEVEDQTLASAPVVVPLSAIVRAPNTTDAYAVFVIEQRDGAPVARLRAIQLGQPFGNAIAVTQGLKPGEQIIVNGATLVTDGERVRVSQS